MFLSVLGVSWFWFFGAALLALLPIYTKGVLHADEHVITLFLALFCAGIGAGSLLCERFSEHKLELGLVPAGLDRHEPLRVRPVPGRRARDRRRWPPARCWGCGELPGVSRAAGGSSPT